MKTPVFAPPSSIFSPTSEGILQLMESGHVKPVVDLKRFLHNHFPTQNILSRPQLSIDLSDKEQILVSLLSHDQGVALPLLVSMSGSDIDELVQLLTMLEIKGIIAQESPGEYVLV
jgi:predicted Rossmann fold nucleotide-binding protein DprA/Smf involved in DNA uptake